MTNKRKIKNFKRGQKVSNYKNRYMEKLAFYYWLKSFNQYLVPSKV